MPTSQETIIDAGGRELRVSSPDREIFPATERTPPITKLDIVKSYLAVDDGIMRALERRPTTLERWPKGVRPGIVLSTRDRGGGDAFYQKRIPRGAPGYVETAKIQFPSGRDADEVCPTELAVVGWAAQMGTVTFHPWPVRREDVDHPDELRIDLDPQPGTDFADAVRAAAYRGRPRPGQAGPAPLQGDELDHVAPEDFPVSPMPAGFARVGDRPAAIHDVPPPLQPLLDLSERDAAEGLSDMPYPPDYP